MTKTDLMTSQDDRKSVARKSRAKPESKSGFLLGFSPYHVDVTNNNAIGVRHVDLSTHRTPAHVLLKWGPQQGAAVIPKASSEARIESNHDLF